MKNLKKMQIFKTLTSEEKLNSKSEKDLGPYYSTSHGRSDEDFYESYKQDKNRPKSHG